jgi:hypothetical protein
MQLGSHVLKAHARDSAAVAGKGRMRLTNDVVIDKVGVACQHDATVQPPTTTGC